MIDYYVIRVKIKNNAMKIYEKEKRNLTIELIVFMIACFTSFATLIYYL
jgi:hypothetical protein